MSDPETPAARLRRLVEPHRDQLLQRLRMHGANICVPVFDLDSATGRKAAQALADLAALHRSLDQSRPSGLWLPTAGVQQFAAALLARIAPPPPPRQHGWHTVLVDDSVSVTAGRLLADGTLLVGESDPEPPAAA